MRGSTNTSRLLFSGIAWEAATDTRSVNEKKVLHNHTTGDSSAVTVYFSYCAFLFYLVCTRLHYTNKCYDSLTMTGCHVEIKMQIFHPSDKRPLRKTTILWKSAPLQNVAQNKHPLVLYIFVDLPEALLFYIIVLNLMFWHCPFYGHHFGPSSNLNNSNWTIKINKADLWQCSFGNVLSNL